jgi:two-component system sensor histidine kinase TctE
MTAERLPSMRARLQRRILVPLALVSLLSTGAVLTVAYVSTSQAFDRALLDDAYSIAAHVADSDDDLVLQLNEREIGMALFDHQERQTFRVSRPDGTVLAGDPRLQPSPATNGFWTFGYQEVGGEVLRTVTLHYEQPAKFEVVVAQTTHDRVRWLGRLAAAAIIPQAVLLLILAWWLGRAIEEEVTPLYRLEMAMGRRDTTDLSPVDTQAPSREVSSLARALNALMRRVADGVAAQREFAGDVAHELRTPLAGIRALADYGLSHDDPAVWREQLAAMAFADEARDGLPMSRLDVGEVVADAVVRCLPTADAQGAELGAAGLDGPVQAWGNVALVEGVLDNLLHNALRYGRPVDGGRQVILVEVTAGERWVEVAVVDNGPGIAPETAASLMQRWRREGGLRLPREGSGLGLAIVARYVELMQGQLRLDAAPGGGLRAVLALRARAPVA